MTTTATVKVNAGKCATRMMLRLQCRRYRNCYKQNRGTRVRFDVLEHRCTDRTVLTYAYARIMSDHGRERERKDECHPGDRFVPTSQLARSMACPRSPTCSCA
jgi:hypothetical protein